MGRALLHLRRDRPDFFAKAETALSGDGGGESLTLTRTVGPDTLSVTIRPSEAGQSVTLGWNGEPVDYTLAAAQLNDPSHA